MEYLIQLIVSGICIGGVYASGALGFVLVFKATSVFNMAHGQMMSIGAFFTATFAAILGLPMWLSLFLSLIATAILGYTIQSIAIRPLTGQSSFSILVATVALIFMLRGGAQLAWGTGYYGYPELILPIQKESIRLGWLSLAPDYIIGLGLALFMLICFAGYFKLTRSGLTMRATADDVQVAQSTGVRVGRIYALAWALAGVAAAIGGTSLGVLTNVDLGLGEVGLKVLPVVVLGGFESIAGACVGGLLVGVISVLSGGYLDPYFSGIQDIVPFVIMMLVLMIRPYGLFGEKRIERI